MDVLCLEAHEHYNKRSFRNRFVIATANGISGISIPLRKGKNEGLNIKSVEIAYETDWQRQSWISLKSAYQRAPFFDYYADRLAPLFATRTKFLYDFNLQALQLIFEWLKWPMEIQESGSYQKTISNQDVIDLRNQIKSANRLRFDMTPYPQVFEDKWGFQGNLSILDLLFCMGPEAKSFIK